MQSYQPAENYNPSFNFETVTPIVRESEQSKTSLQDELNKIREPFKIANKWGIFGPVCGVFKCPAPIVTNESFLGSLSGSEVCQQIGYQTGKVLSNVVGCWNIGDRKVAQSVRFNRACKLQYHPYAYYKPSSKMCVEN